MRDPAPLKHTFQSRTQGPWLRPQAQGLQDQRPSSSRIQRARSRHPQWPVGSLQGKQLFFLRVKPHRIQQVSQKVQNLNLWRKKKVSLALL